MAEKQTILGRIAQLAKANINALLDKAEDPQKMIDQLIRDYTNSIIEAENAIAQTLGNLRMAEKDYEEDVKALLTGARRLPLLPRRLTPCAPPATRPEPTSGTTWPRLPSASRSSSRMRSRPRSPLSLLSAMSLSA